MSKIFDPRTGQFITRIEPAEMIAMLTHELTQRELGTEPLNWPGASVNELGIRLSFWRTCMQADMAMRLAVEDETADMHYWTEEMKLPE